MEHTSLVASELHQAGFKVEKTYRCVWVSLSARGITTTEVRNVLDEKFDGIEFELRNTGRGVLVEVE